VGVQRERSFSGIHFKGRWELTSAARADLLVGGEVPTLLTQGDKRKANPGSSTGAAARRRAGSRPVTFFPRFEFLAFAADSGSSGKALLASGIVAFDEYSSEPVAYSLPLCSAFSTRIHSLHRKLSPGEKSWSPFSTNPPVI